MAAVRTRFTWITAQLGRIEHAVSDDAQEASRAEGRGRYEALCRISFIAAWMDLEASTRCPRCELIMRARAALRDLDERMGEARRRPRRLNWPSSQQRGRHAA